MPLTVRQTVTRLRSAGYEIVDGSYATCPWTGVECTLEKRGDWIGPIPSEFHSFVWDEYGIWCVDGYVWAPQKWHPEGFIWA